MNVHTERAKPLRRWREHSPPADEAIVTSINAGLDMIMAPDKYPAFIDGLAGRIPNPCVSDNEKRVQWVAESARESRRLKE